MGREAQDPKGFIEGFKDQKAKGETRGEKALAGDKYHKGEFAPDDAMSAEAKAKIIWEPRTLVTAPKIFYKTDQALEEPANYFSAQAHEVPVSCCSALVLVVPVPFSVDKEVASRTFQLESKST